MAVGTIQLDSLSAELGDDGVWSSDYDNLATYLNGEFDPHYAEGLAAILPFGTGSVINAAQTLGAEFKLNVEIQPLTELIEGVDAKAREAAEILVALDMEDEE